jgi:hypothetical protein
MGLRRTVFILGTSFCLGVDQTFIPQHLHIHLETEMLDFRFCGTAADNFAVTSTSTSTYTVIK